MSCSKIATPYEVLAENKDFKIIDISTTDLDALSHLADQVNCGRFVNVTHKIQGAQTVVKTIRTRSVTTKDN